MFVLRRCREKVENLDFAHSEPAAVMSLDDEEFMVKLFQYIAAAPAVVQTLRFMSVSS